jgi:O-antigen/teichoic acid export membrane protein
LIENLKSFLKHSIIYSISNVLQKASGVILLPIYTGYFTTTELGIYGILDITINIFSEFLVLGLPNAIIMMNNMREYKETQKANFFTIFIFMVVFCILFVLTSEASLPFIVQYFQDTQNFQVYFRISIYVITFRMLNNLFFNKLRADEKSILYTSGNTIKLCINVGLIAYFVVVLNLKVVAILYAYLISEVVLFTIYLPIMIKQMAPKFYKNILSTSIVFGFPLAFGSLASVFLNLSDRYILKLYSDYSTVGIYEVGYRIAGIINMLLVMPMNLTLLPIAFRIYQKEGDKRYYSKILTYVTFILVWAALTLSMFSQQIVSIFAINKSFYPSYLIIPVVSFAYVFLGMRLVATLGMYLTKNTKHIATTTILASLLNIILNFIFIPRYGMIAAAYNTLIAFIFLFFITYFLSNNYYKIKFENYKIILILIIGVVLYIISTYINNLSLHLEIIIKLFISISFPFVLFLFNFFEKSELKYLSSMIKKLNIFNK